MIWGKTVVSTVLKSIGLKNFVVLPKDSTRLYSTFCLIIIDISCIKNNNYNTVRRLHPSATQRCNIDAAFAFSSDVSIPPFLWDRNHCI